MFKNLFFVFFTHFVIFQIFEKLIANYSGEFCDLFNPCANNPCLNGGNCLISASTYCCNCLPGYSGSNCQNCK